MSVYISHTDLDARRMECSRLHARHPGMIPVVLEMMGKHTKVSFTALSPDMTVEELQSVACEVSGLSTKKRVALTVSGLFPSAVTVLGDLYKHCQNEDGFLYVTYAVENTMGYSVAGPCFAVAGSGGGTNITTTPGQLFPDSPGLINP